jgi:hypothetical protein
MPNVAPKPRTTLDPADISAELGAMCTTPAAARLRIWELARRAVELSERPAAGEVADLLRVLGQPRGEWDRLVKLARDAYTAQQESKAAQPALDAVRAELAAADRAVAAAREAEKTALETAKAATAKAKAARVRLIPEYERLLALVNAPDQHPAPFDADPNEIAGLEAERREALSAAHRLRAPVHQALEALEAMRKDHAQAAYARRRVAEGVRFEAIWERAGLDQQSPRGREWTSAAISAGAAEREAADLARAEAHHAAARERLDAALARVTDIEVQIVCLRSQVSWWSKLE